MTVGSRSLPLPLPLQASFSRTSTKDGVSISPFREHWYQLEQEDFEKPPLVVADTPESCTEIMSFHQLPYDLLLNIASYLNYYDIRALQLTCRSLYYSFTTRPVYRKLAHDLLRRCRPLPLKGFQRLGDLSTSRLLSCVNKAYAYEHAWLVRAPRPISKAPNHYLDGSLTKKWYKVIRAPPGEQVDWLSPITSSYTLCATKSGKVVCWDVQTDTCLAEWNPGSRWELWKCRVEFEEKVVYFTMAKVLHGSYDDSRIMEFSLMKLQFYEDSEGRKTALPTFEHVASFMTVGVVMNIFLLDPSKRLLSAFVWVSSSNTIGLYVLLDWEKNDYVFIDTGIECVMSSNWSCILFENNVVIHCEDSDAAFQHFYPLPLLESHARTLKTKRATPTLSCRLTPFESVVKRFTFPAPRIQGPLMRTPTAANNNNNNFAGVIPITVVDSQTGAIITVTTSISAAPHPHALSISSTNSTLSATSTSGSGSASASGSGSASSSSSSSSSDTSSPSSYSLTPQPTPQATPLTLTTPSPPPQNSPAPDSPIFTPNPNPHPHPHQVDFNPALTSNPHSHAHAHPNTNPYPFPPWFPESAHFVRQWWPTLPGIPRISCTVVLLAAHDPITHKTRFVLAQHYFRVPMRIRLGGMGEGRGGVGGRRGEDGGRGEGGGDGVGAGMGTNGGTSAASMMEGWVGMSQGRRSAQEGTWVNGHILSGEDLDAFGLGTGGVGLGGGSGSGGAGNSVAIPLPSGGGGGGAGGIGSGVQPMGPMEMYFLPGPPEGSVVKRFCIDDDEEEYIEGDIGDAEDFEAYDEGEGEGEPGKVTTSSILSSDSQVKASAWDDPSTSAGPSSGVNGPTTTESSSTSRAKGKGKRKGKERAVEEDELTSSSPDSRSRRSHQTESGPNTSKKYTSPAQSRHTRSQSRDADADALKLWYVSTPFQVVCLDDPMPGGDHHGDGDANGANGVHDDDADPNGAGNLDGDGEGDDGVQERPRPLVAVDFGHAVWIEWYDGDDEDDEDDDEEEEEEEENANTPGGSGLFESEEELDIPESDDHASAQGGSDLGTEVEGPRPMPPSEPDPNFERSLYYPENQVLHQFRHLRIPRQRKRLRFVTFPPFSEDGRVDDLRPRPGFTGHLGEGGGGIAGWDDGGWGGAQVRTLETPSELNLNNVETINIDQSQGAVILSVKEGRIFILCYE